MQYNVEDLATLKKQVSVTVLAADVDKQIENVSVRYRSSVSVPGFRKGKAPLKMIETQFSKDIISEATNNIINKQVHDIIGELALEPASAIEFKAGSVSRGKYFSYSFTFDAMPVFELPNYQDFPVQEEDVVIADSEIDHVLELARGDFAQITTVTEKRLPQDGDIVNLDMQVYDEEGKEISFFNTKGLDFIIGEKQSFAAFEEFVKTLFAGEESEKKILFPEDFFRTEYANKELLMHVKANELKQRILPDLNDELAVKLGKYENLQAVKDSIKESFTFARKDTNRGKAQQKLLEELLKLVEFPLPESMLTRVTAATQANRTKSLQPDDDAEKIAAEAKIEAQRIVKEYVFLHRVSTVEKVEVSENEILQYINQVAARTRRTFAEVRDEYINNNMIAEIQDRIRSSKALNLLYSRAKVEIVSPVSPVPAQEELSKEELPKDELSTEKLTTEDLPNDDEAPEAAEAKD
jgi:trigger factor